MLTTGMPAELSDGDAPAVVRANTEGPWGSSSQLNALRVSQDSQPSSPKGRASMSKRLRSVYSEMQVKVSSNGGRGCPPLLYRLACRQQRITVCLRPMRQAAATVCTRCCVLHRADSRCCRGGLLHWVRRTAQQSLRLPLCCVC